MRHFLQLQQKYFIYREDNKSAVYGQLNINYVIKVITLEALKDYSKLKDGNYNRLVGMPWKDYSVRQEKKFVTTAWLYGL